VLQDTRVDSNLASSFSQRIKQPPQSVVIDLKHQRQQISQLASRESFVGKPGQVSARQVGDQATLVFAKRHGDGDQFLQIFGLHVNGFIVLSFT
jgi:hypothetical protein